LEICSKQISVVENQIDPINLDVLDEYIVKNVKRAVVATKVITIISSLFLKDRKVI